MDLAKKRNLSTNSIVNMLNFHKTRFKYFINRNMLAIKICQI